MDPSSQLSLSTYHNWLGNIDFDSMCRTYLGENSTINDTLCDTLKMEDRNDLATVGHNKDVTNWWAEDYDVYTHEPNQQHPSSDSINFGPSEDTNSYLDSASYHVLDSWDPRSELHSSFSLSDEEYLTEYHTEYHELLEGATGHSSTRETLFDSQKTSLFTHQHPYRGPYTHISDVQTFDTTAESKETYVDSELEELFDYFGDLPSEETADSRLNKEQDLFINSDLHSRTAASTGETESYDAQATDALNKLRASRNHRVRGPKNWEFLMRLLCDSRTNPALIEWEDEERGTFRLKQPKVIAQIWASRNGNSSDLSYHNFARGLRHHYKRGILNPIPERQLVYQCGPKALEFIQQLRCSQTSLNQ